LNDFKMAGEGLTFKTREEARLLKMARKESRLLKMARKGD